MGWGCCLDPHRNISQKFIIGNLTGSKRRETKQQPQKNKRTHKSNSLPGSPLLPASTCTRPGARASANGKERAGPRTGAHLRRRMDECFHGNKPDTCKTCRKEDCDALPGMIPTCVRVACATAMQRARDTDLQQCLAAQFPMSGKPHHC